MSVIAEIEKSFKKQHVVDVKSGDTVRVHQKIREGNKERVQVFEGLVIKVSRANSHTASIKVRRIASGIGVEKTYLIHSPLVTKIEVKKRSKVRRNYLSYMRERTGKSARLSSVEFDREAVNAVPDVEAKPEKVAEEEPAESEEKPAESEKKPEAKSEEPAPDEETKPENSAPKEADQKEPVVSKDDSSDKADKKPKPEETAKP
jgi:large subunit ribosomal protein L19